MGDKALKEQFQLLQEQKKKRLMKRNESKAKTSGKAKKGGVASPGTSKSGKTRGAATDLGAGGARR